MNCYQSIWRKWLFNVMSPRLLHFYRSLLLLKYHYFYIIKITWFTSFLPTVAHCQSLQILITIINSETFSVFPAIMHILSFSMKVTKVSFWIIYPFFYSSHNGMHILFSLFVQLLYTLFVVSNTCNPVFPRRFYTFTFEHIFGILW